MVCVQQCLEQNVPYHLVRFSLIPAGSYSVVDLKLVGGIGEV